MRMIHELRPRDAVKAGKNTFFVDRNIFPQVLSVIETRAKGLGIKVTVGDWKEVLAAGFDPECYGALLQYPAADGEASATERCSSIPQLTVRSATTPHSATQPTRPVCS